MVSTPPFVRGSPPISAGCAAWVSEPAAPSYSLLQNMDQQREAARNGDHFINKLKLSRYFSDLPVIYLSCCLT
jgi:hypothetical protein